MDISPFSCDTCTERWPHLHIMPMDDVFRLESCDRGDGETTRSVLEYKLTRNPQIQALKDIIAEVGIMHQMAPTVRNGSIRNGHHRLATLWTLGARWAPVQQTVVWDNTVDYDNRVREYRQQERV